jgi:hypothetical protein
MPADARLGYLHEKLITARRILMLPHAKGEPVSVASAFFECDLGIRDIPETAFDEHALQYVRVIRRIMDCTGVVDPDKRGLFTVRAHQLTELEKYEFSAAVDDLESCIAD